MKVSLNLSRPVTFGSRDHTSQEDKDTFGRGKHPDTREIENTCGSGAAREAKNLWRQGASEETIRKAVQNFRR